jgi:hypothetical protein
MNAQASKKKKPKRGHLDSNQLAASIVSEATDEAKTEADVDISDDDPEEEPTDDGKNPAAVALGRLGGLKGGPARKAALSERKRREIAKKAAAARWGKREEQSTK